MCTIAPFCLTPSLTGTWNLKVNPPSNQSTMIRVIAWCRRDNIPFKVHIRTRKELSNKQALDCHDLLAPNKSMHTHFFILRHKDIGVSFKHLLIVAWRCHIASQNCSAHGSCNEPPPARHQAILWTNADVLPIRPLMKSESKYNIFQLAEWYHVTQKCWPLVQIIARFSVSSHFNPYHTSPTVNLSTAVMGIWVTNNLPLVFVNAITYPCPNLNISLP